jgi:hypothetical protein
VTHDEARVLAGALADGEPYDAAALDTHLRDCADCAAYATGLDRLRTLTAALPRETAPGTLPARVAARVRRTRRRRWVLRAAPVLAAATAAAVVLFTLPGPASFPLPPAAAAEPLLRLRSLYVERTVTEAGVRHHEQVWWRAPGSVRIDRDGDVTIRTPDLTYENGVVTTGVAPAIALPEPLSPTVALFGTDTGPGTTIAGRTTRRYVLDVGGVRRVAYVDAQRSFELGADGVVLAKEGLDVEKRVVEITLDPDVPDETFVPPRDAARTNEGFRRRALGSLDVAPRARPAGFEVVTAGRGPAGDAVLFADGSLPVLVRTGGLAHDPQGEVRTVDRDGRSYIVSVALYGAPSVQVTTPRGPLTVSAPLPLDSLVALAAAMYVE